MNRLSELLGDEWSTILEDEFTKEYMNALAQFVKQKRFENHVYPSADNVFNAYRLTPYSNVRVCILGQDPYINPNEAHGLSFSTYSGKSTPSLKKIEKSIEDGCYNGLNLEWNNNLERWAKQGVFLLNTILTVDEGASLSHQGKGWEQFTNRTIKELSDRGNVVFLLWGAYAKAYGSMIDTTKNTVLLAEHPAYAARNGRAWLNDDCFNKVNNIIKGDKIVW